MLLSVAPLVKRISPGWQVKVGQHASGMVKGGTAILASLVDTGGVAKVFVEYGQHAIQDCGVDWKSWRRGPGRYLTTANRWKNSRRMNAIGRGRGGHESPPD